VAEVSYVIVWQVAGRFMGTLLAQALFVPAALLVVWIAHRLA
jgi:hypothetical protein